MPFVRPSSLTEAFYKGFGQILTLEGRPTVAVNNGTAQRTNWLAGVVNHRPETATLNLCHFACTPPPLEDGRVKITQLEKHPDSTQVFVAFDPEAEYLVVVCLGDTKPDLSTLRVFRVDKTTSVLGISYLPGIWHSGFIALKPGRFLCLVNESGTPRDTTSFALEDPIVVNLEG